MQFDEQYLQFVADHRADDTTRLRLKLRGDSRLWLPFALENIEALRKSRKFRLPDGADFTPRVIPASLSAQQATSARVAQLHASLAGEACSVLDMTFGLGMDALMLASYAKRRILGFDLRPELVAAAQVNFADENGRVEVRLGDSVEFLRDYCGESFDLIFIDPARRSATGGRLFNLHDCQPDLIELLPLMRRNACKVMAKLSPMLDVSQTIADLPGITALHIVEEGAECKELLAIIDFEAPPVAPDSVELTIDRFTPEGMQCFSFTLDEERRAMPLTPRAPKVGEFLYEPSPAAMKAGPFRLLSERFALAPLHPNTHLYTGVQLSADAQFPGRSYEIVEAVTFTSANIKRLSKELDACEIVVRNLKGFTAESLRRKLRLRDAPGLRLYAFTTSEGPMLLLTRQADG